MTVSKLENSVPMQGAEEVRDQAIKDELKTFFKDLDLSSYQFISVDDCADKKDFFENDSFYLFGYYNTVTGNLENVVPVLSVRNFLNSFASIDYLEKLKAEPNNLIISRPEEYVLLLLAKVDIKNVFFSFLGYRIGFSVLSLFSTDSQYQYYSLLNEQENRKKELLKLKQSLNND